MQMDGVNSSETDGADGLKDSRTEQAENERDLLNDAAFEVCDLKEWCY